MHIVDNREKSQLEATVDGHKAFIGYSVKPGILVLEHTEVDEALKGKGVGSELVESALLEIELRGLKIIPECDFVKHYIDTHPEWKSIVAK